MKRKTKAAAVFGAAAVLTERFHRRDGKAVWVNLCG